MIILSLLLHLLTTLVSFFLSSLSRSLVHVSAKFMIFVASALFLTLTARTIGTSFVHSRLDYCNSMYYCPLKSQLNRIQHILNALARAAVTASRFSNPDHILRSWLSILTFSTKLFPPHISSSSLLLHTVRAISSQCSGCSLLDPLDHLHWLLSSNHWSRDHKPLFSVFSVLHLTCETTFLLVFVFLISLVHHHNTAVLRRQALILDWLLTFLTAFSTLILKLPFLRVLRLLEFDHSVFVGVTVGGNVGECGRLGQPSWLLGALYYTYTYLLIDKCFFLCDS